MNRSPQSVQRILLIRLSALGDCVAAIPVFLALRKRFPEAHLAWIVQDNMAPLLHNLPGLDELILFPRARWKKEPSKWKILKEGFRLLQRLRKRKFDVVIDVQSNTKSAVIGYLSGTQKRIGHGKGEGKEISTWLNNIQVEPLPQHRHVFERNMHLLTALGIKEPKIEFRISSHSWRKQLIFNWIHDHKIDRGYVLLIPFTGRAEKDWPSERYSQLAKELSRQNIPVVFSCSPGRKEETQEMMPQAVNAPILLAPELDIPGLIELIRLSAFVAGGDTGPVHIAGALEKPTFALYGPTDPARHKPWGPSTVLSITEEAFHLAEILLETIKKSG